MSYKFLNASLPMKVSPRDRLTADFNNALNIDFKTASDWFTIQRELPYGSGTYSDIDVRVNRLFEGKTTVSVGDDFKKILFRTNEDAPRMGSMFYFDDNYWIVTNVEAIKGIATTCVVRRCNDVLRWKDTNTGVVYSQPCVIDYLIKETRDYTTGGSSLVQPSGFLEIIVQFNPNTNKVRPSQRFIFGNQYNWNAFKVMGGGVNNNDKRSTMDNMSVGLLRLSLLANQVNSDTDDLIEGIADAFENVYSIGLNTGNLVLALGSSYTLIPTIEKDGTTVSKSVTWSSSDISKATVNQSGVVTPIGVGVVTIKCAMADNDAVFDSCVINVINTTVDNYSILVSPNQDYIYETEEQVFTTTLIVNGISQPDTFTYSLSTNGVPTNNFRYNVLSGNTFWIKNLKRYDDNSLVVTASSGSNSIQIPIRLRGNW